MPNFRFSLVSFNISLSNLTPIYLKPPVGQRQLLVILHVLDCRKADTLELSALNAGRGQIEVPSVDL